MSFTDGMCYTLRAGKKMRNVNGSADDFKIRIDGRTYEWINLLNHYASDTYSKCCCCGRSNSGGGVFGGHVILGNGEETGSAVNNDASLRGGNRVFIAPICRSCNNETDALTVRYECKILHLYGYHARNYPEYEMNLLSYNPERFFEEYPQCAQYQTETWKDAFWQIESQLIDELAEYEDDKDIDEWDYDYLQNSSLADVSDISSDSEDEEEDDEPKIKRTSRVRRKGWGYDYTRNDYIYE